MKYRIDRIVNGQFIDDPDATYEVVREFEAGELEPKEITLTLMREIHGGRRALHRLLVEKDGTFAHPGTVKVKGERGKLVSVPRLDAPNLVGYQYPQRGRTDDAAFLAKFPPTK